ncbi:ABC transporter family substrate-binding protein [Streptomyces sp. NBC_01275]|uniref:ABC transporter family substrate-binding protein n=1 Tax=Streptomyces sp. NBC_01275 TaxID=2903807 RepID=UPI002259E6E2|nr:ABC transporter family substrate-binding protein [Streptomyces sp. NBC_01275]MCX4764744.1 ABC transporter family substrate-binding protein [Streptomyces sp. NBC_01275]
MSHDGVGLRAVMRSVAFLTAGVLAVPLLTACGAEDEAGKPLARQDIAAAGRAQVADGGTLHWAVDAIPETFNTFQSDADATTTRVAQAVLPSMYRLSASGRPQRNADYLESAKVVDTEPKQVVLYKLNQQAVWSDGREIGAADFAAQWRALSGKDSAYWTARNAGYDRIEKIERGANDLEVRVTFGRPYSDWQSLFSPLYPKGVMGTPDSFNDGARRKLKVTAGPFVVKKVDRKKDQVRLTRNPRWWGRPAKLTEIVLKAVPREKRAAALAAGKIELAEIDPATAQRVDSAAHGSAGPLGGPGAGRTAAKALRSWALAHGSDEEAAEGELYAHKKLLKAIAKWEKQQKALRDFEVRRSLEPAYTQLALNGADGPLADERVRRAVARALNRKELAKIALKPLGLPAVPVGSHLALSGQDAYADNSGALGGQDTSEAQALLADAGWVPGGPVKERKKGEEAAGGKGETSDDGEAGADDAADGDGTYIVGEDDKARGETDGDGERHGDGGRQLAQDGRQYQHPHQGGAAGAYAPKGTAAPAGTSAGVLAKDGKALSLRFVLPSGAGSDSLRTVADRIAKMLRKVGIRTEITKVSDESYFKDHVASGQYDLALYSWPASAFPATDARPIYAKPVPAADGSLSVEQNYTRVGTDQVDQLFDQAIATLDEDEERSLIRKADARIWAAAGSIPLYQRPQLTAAKKNVANAGAFGFQTPVYEDMGFLKKGTKASASPSKK